MRFDILRCNTFAIPLPWSVTLRNKKPTKQIFIKTERDLLVQNMPVFPFQRGFTHIIIKIRTGRAGVIPFKPVAREACLKVNILHIFLGFCKTVQCLEEDTHAIFNHVGHIFLLAVIAYDCS